MSEGRRSSEQGDEVEAHGISLNVNETLVDEAEQADPAEAEQGDEVEAHGLSANVNETLVDEAEQAGEPRDAALAGARPEQAEAKDS